MPINVFMVNMRIANWYLFVLTDHFVFQSVGIELCRYFAALFWWMDFVVNRNVGSPKFRGMKSGLKQ